LFAQLSLAALSLAAPCAAQVGVGPVAMPAAPARPAAEDRGFPGSVELNVDATDIDHKVMWIHESLPVSGVEPVTLLYPQWETASHAPTAAASALSGLKVTANGKPVAWARYPTNPFAFRVTPPPGASRLDLEFQYISPTADGRLEMAPDLLAVQWQHVLLYPAGWYARDVPVRASLRLPPGFTAATSLTARTRSAHSTAFEEVSLETLVDSPVFAGRWVRRLDLAALDGAPVRMDLAADGPASLSVSEATRLKLAAMVAEAGRVFGPPHFQHYDFLVSLSDRLPAGGGTEHLRSSENGFAPNFFQHPERNLIYQDLLAHEFVHSWNGKFRTPEALWTPDLNTPSRDDLLWVYEGQTEYWGIVLAARAGLRSRQETLDLLAVKAAAAQGRVGRTWKSLADSALDPVFDAGHGVTWPDWQGREAYYVEGVLLWLDADTLIRERTGGRRSLDDFARLFFSVDGRSEVTRTYTLDDLCETLAQVAPMDWRTFFQTRLQAHDGAHLLDGLDRGGYRLSYVDAPSSTATQMEADEGGLDLRSSLGLLVASGGKVRRVAWDSPAFRAGFGVGAKLTAVNGAPYSDDGLLTAMRGHADPLRLGFTLDGRDRSVTVTGAHTPQYPRLTPSGRRPWLDTILSPRAAAGAISNGGA
jgi:predicted metalloprotease with PDZ domain